MEFILIIYLSLNYNNTVVLTERVSSQLECESVVDDFKSLLDKTEKKHVKYTCSSVLQLGDK